MDNLNRIEKLAPYVLIKDKYTIYKQLKSIKKSLRKSSRTNNKPAGKVSNLLKKAEKSHDKRKQRQNNRPANIQFDRQLPITRKKDEIIHAIKHHSVVIISGETGSGKTTQIPKFCLEAGRGIGGFIGCTQPRRIAAINVASRIAYELNETVGKSVGYKIRFDDKTSDSAYIKLMTDGILLAETQNDRFLNDYDTIIVDEAHERSLNIDFTLGILRSLIKKRKDLKLIITSATIDTEKFSKAFDNAPIIEVSGRMYPVDVMYMPTTDSKEDSSGAEDQDYVEAAADASDHLLTTTRYGDILIFMPTEQDIGATMELLRGRNHPGVSILPLFARLSAKEQSRVFSTGAGRKVIVSTNVAETSLTIPGIKYVIDTGLARIPNYSPRTRTTALPVSPISRSSADQRKGRCGRVENGVCIRLFDENDYNGRPFFTSPEILRSNLAEVILRMISLHLGDVSTFPFIDPPASKSIKDGFDTLVELSAIREKPLSGSKKKKKAYSLTKTGKIMARIPVDPKLSRILIEADKQGCLKEAAIIVSALAISDPRQRPAEKTQAADQKHALFKDPASDFITLLNIWNAFDAAKKQLKSRSKLRKFCQDHFLSFKRIWEWKDIHRQINRILRDYGIEGKNRLPLSKGTKGSKAKEFEVGGPVYTAIHKSLLSGYLANIAHKKEKNMFNAAKGQKAMIFPGSGLFDTAGAWIVAAEFVKTSQLFARGVANIDPVWIEEMGRHLCTYSYSDPHWEKGRGEVIAKQQISLFGLIIASDRTKAYGKINPEEACEIFIRHALVQGEIRHQFPFMEQNAELISELENLENKTRKRDILASEDDMYLFYHSRLYKPFYNIRTFAKFIKDQEDDTFLVMEIKDLQKDDVDEDELALFPDTLAMDQAKFKLEYAFEPGTQKDGVTLKVPESSTAMVSKNRIDRLVPGLFEEKITALIKNLPKKYRVKLVPVGQKAAIIAKEMPKEERPLFSLLSQFIADRFNIDIPASAWSDEKLADHLKMRISIRSRQDKEIKSFRDTSILNQFTSEPVPEKDSGFERARAGYEKENITQWDIGDVEEFVMIKEPKGFSIKVFPGLKKENDTVSLRLFKSRDISETSHKEGVKHLFQVCFPNDFKSLKKDVRSFAELKAFARFFNGTKEFQASLFNSIATHLFAVDIRSKEAFYQHAQTAFPELYNQGQQFLKQIQALCEEYGAARELLKKLLLKYQNRPQTFAIISELSNDLKNLVSPNFLDLYSLEKISSLNRYVACIRIRAQRAADDPSKEAKKAIVVNQYVRHLKQILESLSSESSIEKAMKTESFYWLLEEYKISVFAQELGTSIKVSPKKLDTLLADLSRMI